MNLQNAKALGTGKQNRFRRFTPVFFCNYMSFATGSFDNG